MNNKKIDWNYKMEELIKNMFFYASDRGATPQYKLFKDSFISFFDQLISFKDKEHRDKHRH